MSGTDDLKALLERLKGGVGPAAGPEPPREPSFLGGGAAPAYRGRPASAADARPPEPAPFGSAQGAQGRSPGPARSVQPVRPEFLRQDRPDAANLVWSENKETMLLGMLASVVVLLGGIAASLGWLVIVGAVFFVFFSAITASALFGYARNFRGSPEDGESAASAARLEQLSRKVDGLPVRGGAPQSSVSADPRGGNRDLERKVEELRMLVRSLAKAIEEQDK